MAQGGGWQTTITDDLKVEIESQISVFLAFASADGQPYIRHRGGPPGFVRGHAQRWRRKSQHSDKWKLCDTNPGLRPEKAG